MIRLRDKETGADLGTISEEELEFLQDQLEEESSDGRLADGHQPNQKNVVILCTHKDERRQMRRRSV